MISYNSGSYFEDDFLQKHLVFSNIYVNTHTHTHTHTQSPRAGKVNVFLVIKELEELRGYFSLDYFLLFPHSPLIINL